MGISRWIQKKDLKKDIKIIETFPDEIFPELARIVYRAGGSLQMELQCPIEEILESEKFNVANNSDWASVPIKISNEVRVPLENRVKTGDADAMPMYVGVSVILHSIRAILDYELTGNKDLLFLCQNLWKLVSNGDPEVIPKRFA